MFPWHNIKTTDNNIFAPTDIHDSAFLALNEFITDNPHSVCLRVREGIGMPMLDPYPNRNKALKQSS